MTLADALKEVNLEPYWNNDHHVWRGAFDPLSAAFDQQVARVLESPALHWPYATFVKAGEPAPLEQWSVQMTSTRARPARVKQVRELLNDGYTAKVQHLEHWSQDVARCRDVIREDRHVRVVAYGFVTPGNAQGLRFHRDDSHVLVAQVRGSKDWSIFPREPHTGPRPTIEEEPEERRVDFTLHPGDVMYLPHGWTHAARTTTPEASTHITFTLTEQSPAELLREAAREWAAGLASTEVRPELPYLVGNFVEWLRTSSHVAALDKENFESAAARQSVGEVHGPLEDWASSTPLPVWAARVFDGADDVTGSSVEQRLPDHITEAYVNSRLAIERLRAGGTIWLASGPLEQSLCESLGVAPAGNLVVFGARGALVTGSAPKTGRVRVRAIFGEIEDPDRVGEYARTFATRVASDYAVVAVEIDRNATLEDVAAQAAHELGVDLPDWYLRPAAEQVKSALRAR